MPNKHFCQGPHCHEQTTADRFLKSKGIIRGRYAYTDMNHQNWYSESDKYFCSQRCKFEWLSENMQNIEQGIPIPFITHRRISEGYEKVTQNHGGNYSYTQIQKIGVDEGYQ